MFHNWNAYQIFTQNFQRDVTYSDWLFMDQIEFFLHCINIWIFANFFYYFDSYKNLWICPSTKSNKIKKCTVDRRKKNHLNCLNDWSAPFVNVHCKHCYCLIGKSNYHQPKKNRNKVQLTTIKSTVCRAMEHCPSKWTKKKT